LIKTKIILQNKNENEFRNLEKDLEMLATKYILKILNSHYFISVMFNLKREKKISAVLRFGWMFFLQQKIDLSFITNTSEIKLRTFLFHDSQSNIKIFFLGLVPSHYILTSTFK